MRETARAQALRPIEKKGSDVTRFVPLSERERADNGRRMVDMYSRLIRGKDIEGVDERDVLVTSIGDMLTDLLALAKQHGLTVEELATSVQFSIQLWFNKKE